MTKKFKEGVLFLKKNDEVLKKIIEKMGELEFEINPNRFESLVRIIISQQLSNKASNTILRRIENEIKFFSPEQFLSKSKHDIRKCGVSESKYNSIYTISKKILLNQLNLEKIENMSTMKIKEEMIKIKGVGPWSINIFLIFGMGKLNILPLNDIGILNSVKKYYCLDSKPTNNEIIEISKKWGDYKSIACLFLWKSYDKGVII